MNDHEFMKQKINSFHNNQKSNNSQSLSSDDNDNNMFSDDYIFSTAFNCNNLDKEIFENENYQRKNNQNFYKNNINNYEEFDIEINNSYNSESINVKKII